MSHYAVAVFSDSPDDMSFDALLAPYSETDEAYFVFEPESEEEIRRHWERFVKDNPRWTYRDFLKEMYDERDGRCGHFHNPDAKWDWYTLDGKEYMYDLLPAESERLKDRVEPWPDHFLKSQVDWFRQDEDQLSDDDLRKRWERLIEDGELIWSGKYFLERYGNVEQYIREMRRPKMPYAFITPDGEWHAPGTMGWFAISDETAESMDAYAKEWEDFIRNAPDCYVSIVDCHI